MDTQHRHELKENELYEFFRHFREWWDKHGTSTLAVILLAVAAVVGWRWYSGLEQRKLDAAWSAYASSLSADSLQQVAQAYADVPGVSNHALLRAADQLLYEAVIGTIDSPGIDPTSTTPSEEQKRKIDQAIRLYQQMLGQPQPTEPSLHALNARMGLAACYETLGELDKAREQYNLLRQQAGAYRGHAQMATTRLSELEHPAQPIIFHSAPEPAEAEENAEAPAGESPDESANAPAEAPAAPADTAEPVAPSP